MDLLVQIRCALQLVSIFKTAVLGLLLLLVLLTLGTGIVQNKQVNFYNLKEDYQSRLF